MIRTPRRPAEAETVSARRAEVIDEYGTRVYWYELTLGDGAPEMGPTLVAATRESGVGDYATNKVILDVMMRTLKFSES